MKTPVKSYSRAATIDHSLGTLHVNMQDVSLGRSSRYLGTTIALPPESSDSITVMVVYAGLMAGSTDRANTVHLPMAPKFQPASKSPTGCNLEEGGDVVHKSYRWPYAFPTMNLTVSPQRIVGLSGVKLSAQSPVTANNAMTRSGVGR